MQWKHSDRNKRKRLLNDDQLRKLLEGKRPRRPRGQEQQATIIPARNISNRSGPAVSSANLTPTTGDPSPGGTLITTPSIMNFPELPIVSGKLIPPNMVNGSTGIDGARNGNAVIHAPLPPLPPKVAKPGPTTEEMPAAQALVQDGTVTVVVMHQNKGGGKKNNDAAEEKESTKDKGVAGDGAGVPIQSADVTDIQ